VGVAGCDLGDLHMQKILQALVSNTVTHTVRLGRNLNFSTAVHAFGETQEMLGMTAFFDDPFTAAMGAGEESLQRTQTSHTLAHLLENNTTLTCVDLAGKPNESLSFGVPLALALRSLANNSTVTHLDVSGNLFGDLGAEALGLALCKNRTITRLHTDSNRIGVAGLQALRGCLEENEVIAEWPVMSRDIGGYLDLLAAGLQEATLEAEEGAEMEKDASQGGEVDPVLRQQGVEKKEAAQEAHQALTQDVADIKRLAGEIEQAVERNQALARERAQAAVRQAEKKRRQEQEHQWWEQTREDRHTADQRREDQYEINLVYRVWGRREKLWARWAERATKFSSRGRHCPWWSHPQHGFAVKCPQYLREEDLKALWKLIPRPDQSQFEDLMEDCKQAYEMERAWKAERPHLDLWEKGAQPPAPRKHVEEEDSLYE